ncbi:MAG TPA: peptidylprolyl isomerase [Caulobacteraceae bacterium]
MKTGSTSSMTIFHRRRALTAAAALALPLLATVAMAQSLGQTARPPSRITAPKVDLPSDITGKSAAEQAAAEAAAIPVAPATVTGPQLRTEVAAVVNDDIISSYDLQQRMKLLVMTSGLRVTEENLPQLMDEARRSLIDERLESQEIQRVSKKQKSKDFIADDKEIDEEISDMAKQNNLNYAQLKQAFASNGIDIQTLRDQVRTSITWQRLVGGVYGRNVRVGDDQINNTLQRLSAQASQTQYLMGEIFLDANRVGGEQEAIQGANQLVTQMQQGAPFGGVARQFSAAPTAANGGDTGWLTAAQVQPEVAKALEQLRPGQLSMPIPVSDGVYIIYLRDKQAASGQTMVALKQAAVRLDKDATPAQISAAETELKGLKPQIKGCTNIEQVAAKAPGVISADLGEADISDLRGEFKTAAEKLNAGEVSDPIRTDVGLHLVAVCTKHAGGSKMPTREDIQNRLQSEQLSVMSRRYLRDLRNSATIEAR